MRRIELLQAITLGISASGITGASSAGVAVAAAVAAVVAMLFLAE